MTPNAHAVPASKNRRVWLIALVALLCLALIAGTIAIIAGQDKDDRRLIPRRVAAGDVLVMGAYEQDNDFSNGQEPIEWRVLAVEEDRILVISVCGLDCRMYDSDMWDYDLWETCELKAWLEDDFMQTAFTAEEQAAILEITCLSVEEARTLFADDEDRICMATPYAQAQGAWNGHEWGHTDKGCFWWLRSPGTDGVNDSTYVEPYGEIYDEGSGSWDDRVAVRPALWLKR